MPEIVSDGDPFQSPQDAANVIYSSRTNPGFSSFSAANLTGGPAAGLLRGVERGTQAGASAFDRALAASGMGLAGLPTPEPETTPELSAEDANQRYAPRDLTGKIIPITDKPMPDGLARIVGQQKAQSLQRENVLQRYSETHWGPGTFVAGAVASMQDPINLSLNFIPGIGEEAFAARLGGGFLARMAARAVVGAGVGALATVPVVGLEAILSPEEASDFGMRDALRGILYNAATVAALHTTIGTAIDVVKGGFRAPVPSPAPVLDAATQREVMRTTIGQMLDGREVGTGDFFYEPPRPETAVDLATRALGEGELRPDLEARVRQVEGAPTIPGVSGETLPRPPRPAVAEVPEVIGADEFRRNIKNAGGDLGLASDRLASRVEEALKEGRPVTYYAEGTPVPIVNVDRGMLQDAQGQRWGTMLLATDNTGRSRVEIGGPPPQRFSSLQLAQPDLPAVAQRLQGESQRGWAPGINARELATDMDAVYGRPETGAPAAAAPAETAANAAERDLLERQVAQLPPEAIHPEDLADLTSTATQMEEAQSTLRGAFEAAASCLIGLVPRGE